MSAPGESLEVPALLTATPQVQDPFFNHSVVLLLGHTDEGSFGFNVNRPTTVSIQEILEGMEIPWGGNSESLAYFGGPVQPQLGTVLYEPEAGEEIAVEPTVEVDSRLWMTQHIDDLTSLASAPPESFRLYLGYAGWGAGQLVDEILRNDWIVGPVEQKLIFTDDPDAVWKLALRAAGVDPEALPTWTPPASGGATN